MAIQTLRYTADGLDMIGRLATPDGAATGRRPGVLVFPHAFGPGEHSLAKISRLADELGYVALECDLYGQARAPSMEEFQPLLAPMRESAATVRARTQGALEALLAWPEVDAARVAAMGFCFGGTMAFELALSGAEIAAAIGFHSGLTVTSPGDAGRIRGKVMALLGADDPSIPAPARDGFARMLDEAKVDYTLTVYGGVVHSFTDPGAGHLGRPDFARYDAAADRRSWAQMAELLAEVFA